MISLVLFVVAACWAQGALGDSVPILCPAERLEAVANVLVAVERAVFRGSALYNAGMPDLTAELYFKTAYALMRVMNELGEADVAQFLALSLGAAQVENDASSAAWLLRRALEQLVAAIRTNPLYAPLFVRDTDDDDDAAAAAAAAAEFALAAALQEQRDAIATTPLQCSTGLIVQTGSADGVLIIVEARSAQCDEQEMSGEFFVLFDVEVERSDGVSTEDLESLYAYDDELVAVDTVAIDDIDVVDESGSSSSSGSGSSGSGSGSSKKQFVVMNVGAKNKSRTSAHAFRAGALAVVALIVLVAIGVAIAVRRRRATKRASMRVVFGAAASADVVAPSTPYPMNLQSV